MHQRGPGKTICPSDVSRTIGANEWRSQMDLVRTLAAELAAQGKLRVLQRGHVVDPADVRGRIRLALPAVEKPAK